MVSISSYLLIPLTSVCGMHHTWHVYFFMAQEGAVTFCAIWTHNKFNIYKLWINRQPVLCGSRRLLLHPLINYSSVRELGQTTAGHCDNLIIFYIRPTDIHSYSQSNIIRMTSCLSSKKQGEHFFCCCNVYIKLNYRTSILKSCKPGSEVCAACLRL